MKRFLLAMALTCVLSVSVLAGDIPMTSPAPTPTGSTQTSIAATIILTVISLAVR
jgi:hypothetical protein